MRSTCRWFDSASGHHPNQCSLGRWPKLRSGTCQEQMDCPEWSHVNCPVLESPEGVTHETDGTAAGAPEDSILMPLPQSMIVRGRPTRRAWFAEAVIGLPGQPIRASFFAVQEEA